LNGNPSTMGWTRSHHSTEKQTMANGTNPRTTARCDGDLIGDVGNRGRRLTSPRRSRRRTAA
jgi:hypothetical protein